MCSAATTDTTAPNPSGAAEPAPADLPPAGPSPAAPPLPDAPAAAASGAWEPALPPRTLVVGLGNPLLGDDGVGWRVIDLVEARLGETSHDGAATALRFDVERLAVGGLALMEHLVGYERAILVDAITTGVDAPGTVHVAPLEAVATRAASHLDSSHDAPIVGALAAGRALGAPLPDTITVVTIEADCLDTFDEALSPEVAAAVWPAADAVLAVVRSRPVE